MADTVQAGRLPLSGQLIWPGVAALALVIAVALGWRSHLVPEPVVETLSYVSSSFLLDGAVTAIEIAAMKETKPSPVLPVWSTSLRRLPARV